MDKAGVQIVCRKGKFLVLRPHTPYQATPSGDLFIIHKEFASFQKAATCLYETSKWTWELGWLRLWVSSLEGSKVVFPLFDSPTRENSEHIENAQNREGYYCWPNQWLAIFVIYKRDGAGMSVQTVFQPHPQGLLEHFLNYHGLQSGAALNRVRGRAYWVGACFESIWLSMMHRWNIYYKIAIQQRMKC